MFTEQSSFEIFEPQCRVSSTCNGWMDAIRGHSMLVNEQFTSTINSNGNAVERVTRKGDSVDVYRNLNINDMFSCRQRRGDDRGLVSGYANIMVISNVSFAIGEASRQRVIRQQRKNPHSFVRGNFLNAYSGTFDVNALSSCRVVTYNPYLRDTFYDRNTLESVTKVDAGTIAIVFGSNVYLVNG